jgi:hypothetical protein
VGNCTIHHLNQSDTKTLLHDVQKVARKRDDISALDDFGSVDAVICCKIFADVIFYHKLMDKGDKFSDFDKLCCVKNTCRAN